MEKIAILDCGAQYTKVIDRRIRELRVGTEIFPLEVSPEALKEGFSGIILSGGPNSVYEPGAPRCHPGIFDLGLPVLGICYGMQLINMHFGGTVHGSNTREYGETKIEVDTGSLLFEDLDEAQHVLMSHGDSVETLAPGFLMTARSKGLDGKTVVAAYENEEQRIYGVQFHPEVELTLNGSQMLGNFLYKVCGLSGNFVLADRLDDMLDDLRARIGDKQVFVLVSGGVDSSVTAALLLKALGPEKVFAVHIDSGLMRHDESTLVCEALQAIGLKHLRRIDAEETFLNATTEIDGRQVGPLKNVTDPEAKRRIIGDVFFRLIQQAIAEANLDMDNTFIAQGTLRPDLIESGNRSISATAHKIKTHHNDVPIIHAQREKGLIIEPNQDLHKDEVRKIGKMLGLPEELVMRQPFPGPGLGIRVLCTDTPYLADDYEQTNTALDSLLANVGLTGVILPVQSVGVQGDARTYHHLAALSSDLLSQPWQRIRALSSQITNHLPAINRVAVVLNGRHLPEEVLQITLTYLTHDTVAKLRELDRIVTEAFQQARMLQGISQLLTVLVPVDTSGQGKHSVAIRAVMTSDYMTARPAALGDEIPLDLLREIAQQLSAQPGVDLVMYDITGKPPATVEWE